MLQYVAVCCSMVQCIAVCIYYGAAATSWFACCSILQCCRTLQYGAVRYSTMQYVAVCISTMMRHQLVGLAFLSLQTQLVESTIHTSAHILHALHTHTYIHAHTHTHTSYTRTHTPSSPFLPPSPPYIHAHRHAHTTLRLKSSPILTVE